MIALQHGYQQANYSYIFKNKGFQSSPVLVQQYYGVQYIKRANQKFVSVERLRYREILTR